MKDGYKELDIVPESAVGAYGKPNVVLKANCDYPEGTSPGLGKDYSKPSQPDLFSDSVISRAKSTPV